MKGGRKRHNSNGLNTRTAKFKKAVAAAVKSNIKKSEMDEEKQSKLASEIATALSELPLAPNASGVTRSRNPALDATVSSIIKSYDVRFDEA